MTGSSLIETARAFALRAHEGQTRKGAAAEPYAVHVAEVAELVALWGGWPEAVAAAWLHDTVEDCGVSPEELRHRFGPEVAALVAELTDDKRLPKPERKRLQQVNAPGKSPGAALIKLADKTSNLRALQQSPPVHWDADRQLAYAEWAANVVAALPPLPQPLRDGFAELVSQTRATILLRSGAEAAGQTSRS